MDQDANIDAREFFARFMDDYYADCEEHLRIARRRVVELERVSAGAQPERSAMDDLFRCFHTIKGLSGMVSLTEAEKVAHQLEALLAALRDGRLQFSPGLTSEIEAGVHLLEQIIAAKKANNPIPSVEETMGRLAEIMAGVPPKGSPQRTPHARPASSSQELHVELEPGESCWIVTHVPSKELLERGLSVDKLRTHLNQIGRVLHAKPRAIDKGVAFDFTVASKAEPAVFEALRKEGLECQLVRSEPERKSVKPAKPVQPADHRVPAPPTSPQPTPARATPQSTIVRVDLFRLDNLMRLVGELITSKARLTDQLRIVGRDAGGPEWAALHETSQVMDRQLRDLREAIMRTRLVPIGEAFERMQFAVRDLMREIGKRVQVEVTGQHTEIDKLVVERMMEPLLHIVRNAVSHGIESPEERTAAGKPPEGKIRLSAAASGDTVTVEIEDDGSGVDVEKVTARARAMGLIDDKTQLDESSLLTVLCTPGFSTRDTADFASGRGIGLNVVLKTVHELGGKLTFHTQRGKGTRFTIQLPITLLIADVLIVEVAGQKMAIPQPSVLEVMKPERSSILVLEEDELLPHRGALLPLVRVSRCFGWKSPEADAFYVLVVSAGGSVIGLIVDRIVGHREIVVRALTDPLVKVPGVAGATELGDGRAILILDPTGLAFMARAGSFRQQRLSVLSGGTTKSETSNRVG